MRLLFVTLLLGAGFGLYLGLSDREGALEGSEVSPPVDAPVARTTQPPGPESAPVADSAGLDAREVVRSNAAPAGSVVDPVQPILKRAISVLVELVAHRSDQREPHTMAGRKVEVEWVGAGGVGQVLAHGVTGAEGRFEVECTLSVPAGHGLPRLRARVNESGFTEAWGALSLRDGGATYEGRVVVQAGHTLRGRMVDAKGSPAPGRVNLYVLDRSSGEARLSYQSRRVSKEDGRFAYHAPARAWKSAGGSNQLVLLGRAPGLGTAAHVDFELAELEALQAIELVVHGQGEIRGRLTDGAGEPVPGAKLKVTSVYSESGGPVAGTQARSVLGIGVLHREMAGMGFDAEEAVTGADGDFHWSGLRPGEYLVHTTSDIEWEPGTWKDGQPRTRLTADPVRAGTPDDPAPPLALTLERRQVVVTLLCADGAPWTGPTSIVDHQLSFMYGGSSQWSLRPSVSVTERPGDVRRIGRDLGEGRLAFAIGEADSVEVLVMGGQVGGEGFLVEAQTFGVDPDVSTIPAEFRAVPRVPGGTLRLTGTVVERRSVRPTFRIVGRGADSDGAPKSVFGAPIPRAEVEPVQDVFFLASHKLEIVDVSTGRSVHSVNQVIQSPNGMALPVGRYRVSIRPFHSGETFMGPQCGGASAEVSIADGEEATVRLDVDAGSTVRPYLDLGGPGTKASLWLEDDGGRRTDLSRPDGRFNTWSWPARRPVQSNIVPSGAYTLHAKTESKHVSLSVVLKPRECLDVILR